MAWSTSTGSCRSRSRRARRRRSLAAAVEPSSPGPAAPRGRPGGTGRALGVLAFAARAVHARDAILWAFEGGALLLAAAVYLAHMASHRPSPRELVLRSGLVTAFVLWAVVQLAPRFRVGQLRHLIASAQTVEKMLRPGRVEASRRVPSPARRARAVPASPFTVRSGGTDKASNRSSAVIAVIAATASAAAQGAATAHAALPIATAKTCRRGYVRADGGQGGGRLRAARGRARRPRHLSRAPVSYPRVDGGHPCAWGGAADVQPHRDPARPARA